MKNTIAKTKITLKKPKSKSLTLFTELVDLKTFSKKLINFPINTTG